MNRQMFKGEGRRNSGMSRRTFLRNGVLGTLAVAAGFLPDGASGLASASPPFTLGVASGDPTHNSVILWTRLAFHPLEGGGMPPVPLDVQWRVASDPGMRHVVRRGIAWAIPETAHSVHVEVRGLAPDSWYWYQFSTGGAFSRVGRTRTFPARGSNPADLRFAFVSCQNWEAGYFNAWQRLAEEDIDFVIHLGDYIYEEGAAFPRMRDHSPASEIMTLDDYRNRHAQYKTDPNLQDAHARFPFIVTWDDHEVEDNYAGAMAKNNRDLDPTNDVPVGEFLSRRAHAYRAYFEHMPVSNAVEMLAPDTRIFRRFQWGRLAEFHVLDTRQYRTNQPCGGPKDLLSPAGDDLVIACGEELDGAATIMGSAQEHWLLNGLSQSKARWQVIAQQLMMASVNFGPGVALADPRLTGLQVRNVDAWDGYVAARDRLLGHVIAEEIKNLIVLTGDVHSSWVADLHADFSDLASPVVATEFVGTSITSIFPASFIPIVHGALAAPENRHVKFFDGVRHGYIRCTVTPEQWRSDYRTVDTIMLQRATIETLKSFVVHNGRPGAITIG